MHICMILLASTHTQAVTCSLGCISGVEVDEVCVRVESVNVMVNSTLLRLALAQV